MSYLFEFTLRAEADLETIGLYIAKHNPKRAVTFMEDLYRQCVQLTHHPNIGPARPDIGRVIRVIPYKNYLILYAIQKETVIIKRIVHGARHPSKFLQ
jgi:plasmid stabilization system protein ParE